MILWCTTEIGRNHVTPFNICYILILTGSSCCLSHIKLYETMLIYEVRPAYIKKRKILRRFITNNKDWTNHWITIFLWENFFMYIRILTKKKTIKWKKISKEITIQILLFFIINSWQNLGKKIKQERFLLIPMTSACNQLKCQFVNFVVIRNF